MWRVSVFVLVLAALAPAMELRAQPAAVAPVEAAQKPVGVLYSALIECMKQAESLDVQGRADLLGPAVSEAYDMEYMSAKVLGRHWRKLSPEQKSQWQTTFSRLTVHTYATRFDGLGGERFEVLSSKPSERSTVLVLTQIVPSAEDPVAINYRVAERNGQWRIVDVYLNGTVSELALRRSEYGTVMKRDGFERLVSSLGEKISDVSWE